jgi:hypothetical protein
MPPPCNKAGANGIMFQRGKVEQSRPNILALEALSSADVSGRKTRVALTRTAQKALEPVLRLHEVIVRADRSCCMY